MKVKILIKVLSIFFCSNIFSIQFTNNTNYKLKIAIEKKEDKNYKCKSIKAGKTKKFTPFQDGKFIFIGLKKTDLRYFPAPKKNIIITEDKQYFIVSEEDRYTCYIEKINLFVHPI